MRCSLPRPIGRRLRRVLVTGAAGFVGSQVVAMLSSNGRHEVLATDVARSPKSDALAELPGVEFHAMDLRDRDGISDAVRSVDAVVHLAAMRLRASDAQPREGFGVNVAATFDLLTAAAEHDIRAFVYGSSQQLYGSFSDEPAAPMREEDGAVGRDVSMYAAAKLACEAFLPPFAARGGFGYLALRFGSIYGPDAAEHSNSWMMLEALRAVDRGERARVSLEPGLAPFPRLRRRRCPCGGPRDRSPAAQRRCQRGRRARASTHDIYSTLLRLYGADPEDVDFSSGPPPLPAGGRRAAAHLVRMPRRDEPRGRSPGDRRLAPRIRLTSLGRPPTHAGDATRDTAASIDRSARTMSDTGCSRATTRSSSTASGCRRPHAERIDVVSPWSEERHRVRACRVSRGHRPRGRRPRRRALESGPWPADVARGACRDSDPAP